MNAIPASRPDAPQRDGDTRGDRARELTDKARERQPLRGLLLASAASAPTVPADNRYFDALRERVRKSMIRKIIISCACFFAIGVTGLTQAHAEKIGGANDRFLMEFIEKYGRAAEVCKNSEKNRSLPKNKYIVPILKLSKNELHGFLIYKWKVAMNHCIEEKSGYPFTFLLSIAGSEDLSPKAKESLGLLLKLLASENTIDAFYEYQSIPYEKKRKLDAIGYFNKPFDLIKIYGLAKRDQARPGWVEHGENLTPTSK